MNILVVDDESASRVLLEMTLKEWGHEVTTAASAIEALACIGTDPTLQLMITDWVMPDIDGLELCRMVRKLDRTPYLHIAILTARSEKEDLLEALEAGADAFLPKSYDLSELKAQLKVAQRIAHLEENLAAQVVAAQSASQAKSDFLASVSHEIRTPMNGVLGLSRILRGLPDATPQQREYAELIHQSAENLLVLLNDILDFSKIEAGRLDLVEGDFSVEEVVSESMAPFVARVQDVALTAIFPASLPRVVRGDRARLRQVLLNLISNAVKFTEKGAITLRVEMGDKLRFSVEDTGTGVSDEMIPLLFEPFRQAATDAGGTGLGLSICRRLVELMGGTIEFASTMGQGSTVTFTVDFPIVEPASEKPPSPQGVAAIMAGPFYRDVLVTGARQAGFQPVLVASLDEVQPEVWLIEGALDKWPDGRVLATSAGPGVQALGRPLTSAGVRRALLESAPITEASTHAPLSLDILAVEDNRVNQTVLRLMLEEHGCNVTLASSGNEALGKVKERGYDLIFMDLRMPGMDGLETTSRLRALEKAEGRPASPIVALTAQALPEDRERCKQAGMDGFLSKPLVADELEALLQTYRRPA